MDFAAVTDRYYSRWIGDSFSLSGSPGLSWVFSPERDAAQVGYSVRNDLYVWLGDGVTAFSYGTAALPHLDALRRAITVKSKVEDIKQALAAQFDRQIRHQYKYVFREQRTSDIPGVQLTLSDYPLYLDFFEKANPDCKDTEWVQAYFSEICAKGHCHAVIADGECVSVTDAPGMPYMEDVAQEIGINTLPGHRGKGYAKAACISCANWMVSRGVCPQWSTSAENTASQRLALGVGFVKLADVLTLTL